MDYFLIGSCCLGVCIIAYFVGNSRGKKAERELRTEQSRQLANEIVKQKEERNQNQHQLKVLHESVNQMEYLRLQRERTSDDETATLIKRRTEKLSLAVQQRQQQLSQLEQQYKALQDKNEILEKQYKEKEMALRVDYFRHKNSYEYKNRQFDEAQKNIEESLTEEQKKFLSNREASLNSLENELTSRKERLDDQEHSIQAVINSSIACNPFLAQQFADCLYMADLKYSDCLKNKSHPAFTAAEKVREIAKQKRVLQEQCKLQQYQLNLYETAFPWLAEFKEISAEDLQQLASVDTAPDSEYSSLKKWLSPQEYQSLPSAERLQLALERYTKRQKTNWQIGIEYERYVGYCYERKGYKVRYFGATEGLEDMGRDLIVTQGKKLFVIQCKRWSTEKTIHEKHIFQLYGTTILQMLENPDKRVSGLFITTTKLSELAKSCADYLHITVVENYPLREYPLIKCNISKNGEKIYHLPFDQQYDRVMVEPDDGDCYASTVQEAESKGFRHAWRWHSS